MMSWKRQENINYILKKYSKYDCVDEIIVWNNNKLFFVSDLNIQKVKTINSSCDFGLNTRFVGSIVARNRCVIVHDDDLILSENNIIGLIKNFEQDHTKIYSYEGRIYQKGKYDRDGIGRIENVDKPTEVDMVLTRSACFDRLYAIEYCKLSDIMFYDVDLNLNGEDIILSHIVSNHSGNKPLVIPIPDKEGYVELPIDETEKISIKPNFIEFRNDLIDRCSIVLPTPKYDQINTSRLILFGQKVYPVGYYENSFSVNSKYKKALIKNDTNGIKYISHEINPSRDWSILYIDIDNDFYIKQNDHLVIKSLFKNSSTPVSVELVFLQDDIEKLTPRTKIRSKKDFVSCDKIHIANLLDYKENIVLKSIKFVLNYQSNYDAEFCITELSIE